MMQRLFGSTPSQAPARPEEAGQGEPQDTSPSDQPHNEEVPTALTTAPQAPTTPVQPPPPQAEPFLTDRQKWSRSMARWQPTIQPGDPVFQTRLAAFQAELRAKSVNDVLSAHFSSYEIQKVANGFVPKARLPAIYAAQHAEARRFRALMARAPWNDRTHRKANPSPLAWKLTLLWFGLPVAPMRFEDALGMTDNIFTRAGAVTPFRDLDDDEGAERDDDADEDVDMSFVPDNLRPLRFLNYFDKRGFGRDNSHMTPEKTYELYYSFPMMVRNSEIPSQSVTSLRGGGSCSEDEADSVMGYDMTIDDEPPLSLSLRGGSGGASLSQQPAGLAGDEALLWGLSGRTYFHLTNPSSFFAAVNRLLGFPKHTDGAGITVSLLSHPTNQRTPCTVVTSDQCFLGRSAETELNFYKTCLDTVRYFEENVEKGEELSMCVSQLSDDIHFSDRQEDLSYRPSDENHEQLVIFSREGLDNIPRSLAYLDMSDKHQGTPANSYQKWFKSIWRTLSPDYETQPCLLQLSGTGLEPLPNTWFHSDTGITREVWEWFVNEYYHNGQQEFTVHAIPVAEMQTTWLWHLPGFDTVSYNDDSSFEDIFSQVFESLPEPELEDVRDFLIRPFNFHGFLDKEGEVVVSFKGQVVNFRSEATMSQWGPKLHEWKKKGYPMHILPRWDEYEITTNGNAFKFGSTIEWATVLEVVQTLNGNSAGDMDVLLEQRHDGDGARGKNKVCWQLEAKDTPEMESCWRHFLNTLTTSQVTLSLITKSDEEKEDTAGSTKTHWGSHDHSLDVLAFMEQQPRQSTAESSLPPFALPPTGSTNPIYPSPSDRLTFDSTGYPLLGTRLDDFAKSKALREWSYARPLSLHMENQQPSIPINAPPLETILKTPALGGLPSNSVPVMSTAVMTATEQRQMQETLFQLRTIALYRAQPCPYAGCMAYFPVDEAGMTAFRTHLTERHTSKKCPFCTERLFAHWTPAQVKDHFITNHADYFSRRNDLARDVGVKISHEQHTHRREEAWNFCARCGRNHSILVVKADRAQHDNLCYPGGENDRYRNKYCTACGQNIANPARANPVHDCLATGDEAASNAFCQGCALPCHEFSRVYAQKHIAHCKGLNCRAAADWCVWCGLQLQYLSHAKVLDHLEHCLRKPAYAESPLNPATGQPQEGSRSNNNSMFLFRTAESSSVAVPEQCPVSECRESLRSLGGGRRIFKHFVENHKVELPKLAECPLCHLNFTDRGWSGEYEKTMHFDDHVHVHALHIIVDLEIARERRVDSNSRRIFEVEQIRGLYEDLKRVVKRNAMLMRELEELKGKSPFADYEVIEEQDEHTVYQETSPEKRSADDSEQGSVARSPKRHRSILEEQKEVEEDLDPEGESYDVISPPKSPVQDDNMEILLKQSRMRASSTGDDYEETEAEEQV